MSFLSAILLGHVLGVPEARAADLPKPSFQLNLEPYDLPMRDYNFPSGMRIIFQEDHTQPIVAVTVVLDRGSSSDPVGVEGIAHVVEHMVFKAKHGDLPKNWDVLEELGAMLNASTSSDWTDYLTVVPRDSLAPVLRIEALRLSNPLAGVTAEELTTEREVVRNELRMRYENAAVGAAWEDLGALMYPVGHPYSRTTIGTHESLGNIDLKAIQDFTKNNYTAQNATLVVVGDIDLDKTGEIIAEAFAGLDSLLVDPKKPDAPIVLREPKPRVDCAGRAEPPPPVDRTTRKVKGPIDKETVVVAWSLPGGYCADEPAMEMAASLLSNYIQRTLVPTWEYGKADQEIEGLGCFLDSNRVASRVICFVEPKAGIKGGRLVDKIGDALYLQNNRELMTNEVYRPFFDYADRYARSAYMTSLFQGVDNVASLSGRAAQLAHFAHFTGSAQFYSDSITGFNGMDRTNAMALGEKYITRERMVSVIVEPMDANERARREVAAKAAGGDKKLWEGATAEMAYSTVFDAAALTPDAVMNATVVPDLSKARSITLDNGLKVTLLPYGAAPIVRGALVFRGSDNTAPFWGMDTLAEALAERGTKMQENILAVAGSYGEMDTSGGHRLTVQGSSGNLDALLYKLRHEVQDFEWYPAEKRGTIDDLKSNARKAGEEVDVWAERLTYERLFPGSPLARWWAPDNIASAEKWEYNQLKSWIGHKYQPSNAELVLVGRMDADKAEAMVRSYFSSWKRDESLTRLASVEIQGGPTTTETVTVSASASGGALPGSFAPPTQQPVRQILVFDKPLATQTQIDLSCQLTPMDAATVAPRQVLGEAVSGQAFRKLREEVGVTYGAYAYTQSWPGGSSIFGLSSLVENSAVGFAVNTMMKLAENAAKGQIAADEVARSSWSLGRKYVYGETSSSQMLNRLASTRELGFDFDFFNTWRSTLAHTTPAQFTTLMAPCIGHEVVTVIGPKEYAEPQLKEAGVAYELVNWEALQDATLTPKELKDKQKKKAKEEADKAKKGTASGLK